MTSGKKSRILKWIGIEKAPAAIVLWLILLWPILVLAAVSWCDHEGSRRRIVKYGRLAASAEQEFFDQQRTFTRDLDKLYELEPRLKKNARVTFSFTRASESGYSFFAWIGRHDMTDEGVEIWYPGEIERSQADGSAYRREE